MSRLNHNPYVTELGDKFMRMDTMLSEKFADARKGKTLEESVQAIEAIFESKVVDALRDHLLDIMNVGLTADIQNHPVLVSEIPDMETALTHLNHEINEIRLRYKDVVVDPVLNTSEWRDEMKSRFIALAAKEEWKAGLDFGPALKSAMDNGGYPSAYIAQSSSEPTKYEVKLPNSDVVGEFDISTDKGALTKATDRVVEINEGYKQARLDAIIKRREESQFSF